MCETERACEGECVFLRVCVLDNEGICERDCVLKRVCESECVLCVKE